MTAKQVKQSYNDFLRDIRLKQFGYDTDVESVEDEKTKPAKKKGKKKDD